MWQVVVRAVGLIQSDSHSAIDLNNFSAMMGNIAKEEGTSFLNLIATLDILKWQVLRSVNCFSRNKQLSDQQINLLMETGKANAKEISPEMEGDDELEEKVAAQLKVAIKDLLGDPEEIKRESFQQLGEIFGTNFRTDKKCAEIIQAVERLIGNKTRGVKAVLRSLIYAVKKSTGAEELTAELVDKIHAIAKKIADSNEDRRSIGERVLSFLWINLLLPKSKRYAVSPMSGFTPGFINLPMEALDHYLKNNPAWKNLRENIERLAVVRPRIGASKRPTNPLLGENFNDNSVWFLRRFIANPDAKVKSLASNKIVTIPTIKTDGYQILVNFIDLRRPSRRQEKFLDASNADGDEADEVVDGEEDNCDLDDVDNEEAGDESQQTPTQRADDYLPELSRYFAKNPERPKEIRTVMAVDEGVRFPIDVTVIQMPADGEIGQSTPGVRRRMRVRKGCLYQHENQRAEKLAVMKANYPAVGRAEVELAATGTKYSLDWASFRDGYYSAWLKHHETLLGFYGAIPIRASRMECAVRRQSLYDNLVDGLLKLMGVRFPTRGTTGQRLNADKLVVLGMQKISTKHNGNRDSKHAVFWRYVSVARFSRMEWT
jgi:hypothetical protein